MAKMLEDIDTIFFCDETKFSANNGDIEDATFYFGVAVKKDLVGKIKNQFREILAANRVKSEAFHATQVFREKRIRLELMMDIHDLITKNNLHCYCLKYDKKALFGITKQLNYLNNDILDFNDPQFQALFYFLVMLNAQLKEETPTGRDTKSAMFFDRNVYGKEDTDIFNLPSDFFAIKHMTFVEKSLVGLLALPDFMGYIFRKSKKSEDRILLGNELETSQLTINCYFLFHKIKAANLFHFLDIKSGILEEAFEALKSL